MVENDDFDLGEEPPVATESSNQSDINVLKQQLVEVQAKLKAEQNNATIAQKKLKHVEKVASQRIVESLPGSNFDSDTEHLAMLLATVLEKDDFNYDPESDRVEPKLHSDFLFIFLGNLPYQSEENQKF